MDEIKKLRKKIEKEVDESIDVDEDSDYPIREKLTKEKRLLK